MKEHGAVCVMMDGTVKKLELPADTWDLLHKVIGFNIPMTYCT